MVLRLRDDDAVDENTGDLHLSCAQAAGVGDPLHLHNHQAAGVVDRGRHGKCFEGERLALHGDVPLGVRGGAAEERDVQLQSLVEQVLLAVQGEQFDAVLCGPFVNLAAAVTRVDEGAKSDAGDQARLARGGVPEQMRNDPLRQVVRLDLVAHSHFSQRR